jgi:hypothetical protein
MSCYFFAAAGAIKPFTQEVLVELADWETGVVGAAVGRVRE